LTRPGNFEYPFRLRDPFRQAVVFLAVTPFEQRDQLELENMFLSRTSQCFEHDTGVNATIPIPVADSEDYEDDYEDDYDEDEDEFEDDDEEEDEEFDDDDDEFDDEYDDEEEDEEEEFDDKDDSLSP